MQRLRGRLRLACALAAITLLAGCGTLGYYGQAIQGHLAVLHAARPVSAWLADPQASAALKTRLELAVRIRRFAVRALDLPDNASYQRYADLQRRAVVWNVAAAPVDALTLKRWCFPLFGCVAYRGYYDEAAARALARALAADGKEDVVVYGVPAYSTLGWLNWLGGDPLLSTFIGYPEGVLAGLIFHELAHQKVYVKGDTEFDESYANAVAELGVRAWFAAHPDAGAEADYARYQEHRRAFTEMALRTRGALQALYACKKVLGEAAVLQRKAALLDEFRARYAALKAEWAAAGHAFDGWDAWVAGANNARFGVLAAYDARVPAFKALFAEEGGNWARFHAAVRALGDLPKEARDARLDRLGARAVDRHALQRAEKSPTSHPLFSP